MMILEAFPPSPGDIVFFLEDNPGFYRLLTAFRCHGIKFFAWRGFLFSWTVHHFFSVLP